MMKLRSVNFFVVINWNNASSYLRRKTRHFCGSVFGLIITIPFWVTVVVPHVNENELESILSVQVRQPTRAIVFAGSD